MMRFFERELKRHMFRKNVWDINELVRAMHTGSTRPCRFDASYVKWSLQADEPDGVDPAYFACLRGALWLTEFEALDLIRAFYFGEGPYPL